MNEDNGEAQVDETELTIVLRRLSDQGGLSATRICARLDDEYGVEPGTHLQILRYGVARHMINAPIQTSYHNWKCSYLTFTAQAAAVVSKHAN